jgi:hypothetical protein
MGGILTKQTFFKFVIPLRNELYLNDTQTFILCLTVNTMRLHYKDKLVNAIKDTVAVYFEKRQTCR